VVETFDSVVDGWEVKSVLDHADLARTLDARRVQQASVIDFARRHAVRHLACPNSRKRSAPPLLPLVLSAFILSTTRATARA